MEVIFQKIDGGMQNESQRGATRCPSGLVTRPPWWPCRVAAWTPGATPVSPLWPIYSPSTKTPKRGGVSRVPPLLRGGILQRIKDISSGRFRRGEHLLEGEIIAIIITIV